MNADLWESVSLDFFAAQAWRPSGAVLLAVSGGADSVAMLHFFVRQASRFDLELHVAHLDHGLREASAVDRDFVAQLCRKLSVPFHVRALDPRDRKAGESTEMWARRERYAFFGATADAIGARWILTAHHRDDLVETVFQRLARGTGPRGLQGIPFRRGRIVRPFLDRNRADVRAYLDLLGARWREDESNADARIDRNWYRLCYLPALRAQEPDLDARVLSLALRLQAIGKGLDALEEESALLRSDRNDDNKDGGAYLIREGLDERVRNGDRESLRYWLQRLLASRPHGGSQGNLRGDPARASVTREILDEFIRQWKDPARMQVPMGGGVSLKCGKHGVYCVESKHPALTSPRKAKKSCPPPAQRVILEKGSGEISWRWGERTYTLSARRYPRPENLAYPAAAEGRAIFDADLFSCTLQVRTRKDGDRFSPLGIHSRSRKLKTFFNAKKVPIGTREELPIVMSGETPAWIPGYGISDFFKIDGSTSHILELVLKCRNA